MKQLWEEFKFPIIVILGVFAICAASIRGAFALEDYRQDRDNTYLLFYEMGENLRDSVLIQGMPKIYSHHNKVSIQYILPDNSSMKIEGDPTLSIMLYPYEDRN